jgi:YD repeat-containing protein
MGAMKSTSALLPSPHDEPIDQRVLPALLTLAMMTGAVSAQQRALYDARGNVVGCSATDSQGTTTMYDARERLIGKRQ